MLQHELANALIPAIDDQLFYAMTGYRKLGVEPAPRTLHLSEEAFTRYRHMAELQENATIAIQLLTRAFDLSDVLSLLFIASALPTTARFSGTDIKLL